MNHKISVFRSGRILGKAGEKLPDEEVELMLGQCYALAEMMFEHFQFDEKLKEIRPKYVQS